MVVNSISLDMWSFLHPTTPLRHTTCNTNYQKINILTLPSPTQNNSSTKSEEFLKCRHWPACKFYTSNAQSLKNHELTHYAQQNLYTCSDCNIHFTNKSSKDEHTRRKHKTWAKVYSCSHCNYETSLLDEFSEHNVAYHLDAGTSGNVY